MVARIPSGKNGGKNKNSSQASAGPVSLSDCSDSNQSVISEIFEGLDADDRQNDAVKALFMDGLLDGTNKTGGRTTGKVDKSRRGTSPSASSLVKDGLSTVTTANSTTSDNQPKSFFEDIQSTYTKFKIWRNNGASEKPSISSGIMEDVQFCALYFCGVDIADDDDDINDFVNQHKEARMRETDQIFLGKVIICDDGVCAAIDD